MSILSVSLTPEIEEFIEQEMSSGEFESKGQLVKKALKKFEEDRLMERLTKASEDIRNGLYLEGDLEELSKKFK